MVVFRRLSTAAQKRQSAHPRSKELSLTLSLSCSRGRLPTLGPLQSCKKITILDLKDRDLFIDLDLLHDLDQFIDLLKLILIFDL